MPCPFLELEKLKARSETKHNGRPRLPTKGLWENDYEEM
jgi:hypothetical protein